jgi:cobalamin biosynthesis protein CobT
MLSIDLQERVGSDRVEVFIAGMEGDVEGALVPIFRDWIDEDYTDIDLELEQKRDEEHDEAIEIFDKRGMIETVRIGKTYESARTEEEEGEGVEVVVTAEDDKEEEEEDNKGEEIPFPDFYKSQDQEEFYHTTSIMMGLLRFDRIYPLKEL